MSEENVELMRRALEAVNQGDDDAWIAAWHPEAELYELVGIPDAPQVYRGHDGVREWLANARSILGPDLHMEPTDFTPIGEVVLTEIVGSGVGEGSGVPVKWTATSSPGCGTASLSERGRSRGVRRPSKSPGCRSSALDESRSQATSR